MYIYACVYDPYICTIHIGVPMRLHFPLHQFQNHGIMHKYELLNVADMIIPPPGLRRRHSSEL